MTSVNPSLGLAVAVTAALLAAGAAAADESKVDDSHHVGFRWNFASRSDGKQTQKTAFDNCLCWNTTSNNWCHHHLDGDHTGFWRDSCARVIAYNAFWWFPIVLWCIALILLPLFFCAFRMCCNCCGGRQPTFGCCCPISNSVVSPDPKFVRPYSICATFTAKALAFAVFASFVTLSVHSFLQNSDVSQDVMNSSNNLGYALNRIESRIEATVTLAKKYSNMKPTPPAWFTLNVEEDLGPLTATESTLGDISRGLLKTSTNENKYRQQPTNWVVAMPLLMITIVTLLSFCNVRGWPVSICAGLLSFMTVFLVFVAAITLSIGQGFSLACEHSDTVTQFTQDVFTSDGYCNDPKVTRSINATQIAAAKYMCNELGLKAMLVAAASSPSTGFCEEVIGGMYYEGTMSITASNMMQFVPVVDASRVVTLVGDASLAKIQYDSAGTTASIAKCALNPACTQHTIAKGIYEIARDVFNYNMEGSLQYMFVNNYNCYIVRHEMLYHIQPLVCGTGVIGGSGGSSSKIQIGPGLQTLGGFLFALCGVATLTFWVWMNGSKRFTKGTPSSELLRHHQLHHLLTYGAAAAEDNTTPEQDAPIVIVHHQQIIAVVSNNDAPPRPGTDGAEQPLLLSHTTPDYGGQQQHHDSVNYRHSADTDAPSAKQQPAPL